MNYFDIPYTQPIIISPDLVGSESCPHIFHFDVFYPVLLPKLDGNLMGYILRKSITSHTALPYCKQPENKVFTRSEDEMYQSEKVQDLHI